PQTNTAGLASPRLRFDAAAKPVIGVIAAVGSSVVYAGTAVYRYDGAQWASTGGFVADSSFVNNGAQYMGFTVSGSEAFMGWVNTHNSQNSPVVQKNTALGWAPIGAGLGEIPQYTISDVNDKTAWSLRLRAVNGEVFLALVVDGYEAGQPGFHVTLLRKVAD
ncbi:MAG: hypothetical protein WCF10_01805, partial [Polyangiales bacterium]